MASLFQQVNQLAIQIIGQNPNWAVQSSTSGAPSAETDGVSMGGAVINRVSIELGTATSVDIRVHRLPGGSQDSRPGWGLYEEHTGIDEDGLQLEIPVGGYQRCYIEVTSSDGTQTVTQGPCGLS